MASVQAHTARLIALFVSCVLYGILLTTLVPCLHSLLFSASRNFQIKPRHEIKLPILATTILMFFVSSFSAVISMQDVIDAFINYQGPGGALEFYGTLDTTLNHGWTHWMPAVEDSVQVTLGDGLLIYRCYVLYGRKWRVIILPSLAWMGLVATSVASSYREITLKPGQSLNDVTVLPTLSAALLFTFATSVTTTFLIIRKLLECGPTIPGGIQPHILTRIANIFFETGLIYTLSVVLSLGIYLTGSNLEYVVSLAMIHIVPITCNLLLIRIEGVSGLKRFEGPEPEPWEVKFNPRAAVEV
ncbi:hypothetical protein B0H14DRAFT_2453594 [Mycena olivaceomarginata]|nr:hypothetical protein B0H14DRAFT_2864886 [Mycena olivaceomarginata]KAJ7825496.1 hypothetical protein B0H14DRAFT_2453594 [Mycena olivaceomarginata]